MRNVSIFKYDGCALCGSVSPSYRGWVDAAPGREIRCDSIWHEKSPHEFKWAVEAPPGDNLGATETEIREILIASLETYTAEPRKPILDNERVIYKSWPRRIFWWVSQDISKKRG